jgi:hypothetical protein
LCISEADDDKKTIICTLSILVYILNRIVDIIAACDGKCGIVDVPAESIGRKRGYTSATNWLQIRPALLSSLFVSLA